MTPLWIIGSGGHARVVIDTARATGEFDIVGCLDDNPNRHGQHIAGVLIHGPLSNATLDALGVEHAIIAIGANPVRQAIAVRFGHRLQWATVVHPHAWIASGVRLGHGTVVCAGAVIQPDTRLGDHTIVNTGSSIDHDCTTGECSHIAPGTHLAGNITIGEGAFIGIGSSVIPGIGIGEWTTVGAGSVVIRDLPANVTAVGSPARIVREHVPGWHRP